MIVVGSGATGTVAARRLALSGLRVLVCEAGSAVANDDRAALVRLQPPSNASRQQPVQSRLPGFSPRIAPFLVDDTEHPYVVDSSGMDFAWLRSRGLGGRTLLWGGVCPRLAPINFTEGRHDGRSPEWPIALPDLEPHYAVVEGLLGVSDAVADAGSVPPLTAAESCFADVVVRRWPDRRVQRSRGIAGPAHRRDRSGGTWPAGALVPHLQDLIAQSKVSVRTDSAVASLSLDGDRVVGVHVVDRCTLEVREERAEAIVLAASTIETARILLNSRSPEHPGGVGQSSGWLGRGLMDHPALTVTGRVPGAIVQAHDGPPGGARGLSIPRFRNTPESGDTVGFVRGYQVWGHAARATASDGTASFMMAASGEMLPNPENRVTLHETAVDALGLPVPVIRFAYGHNERALMADAQMEVTAMCTAAGFVIDRVDRHDLSIGTYIHEVGTARMGRDPANSVVDPWNRVWDAPNVLVVDGACWPTSAHQNPTLTMMALADRACAALVDRSPSGAPRANPR